MKIKLSLFIFLISNILIAQGPANLIASTETYFDATKTSIDIIDANGFDYQILDAGGINSKYSEFGSAFFRNKFILVSSRKLGGIAKIDPNTNEAYKDLFCVDMNEHGYLSMPLLFSRMINTNNSEGQVTFSPDEHTMYFTRSNKQNSLIYKLYKATLEEGSNGNWKDEQLLNINKGNVSIENPFVNPAGDKLYFSSNMAGTHGGFDIFVSDINLDGTLSVPKNLGSNINTNEDEKYPSLSKDGRFLYFSSKGHRNMGGFDVFRSKILKNSYKAPRNLGNTINSRYDEVAFILATKNKGYVSTNKNGSFDIFRSINRKITQSVVGKTVDLETKIALPNTLVVLFDEEGEELSRQKTGTDASYSFDVEPFEIYNIKTYKDGFVEHSFDFVSNRNSDITYRKNLELNPTVAVFKKVRNNIHIKVENIFFDSAKWDIKPESQVSLNKILKVLNDYPDLKIAIKAHTDSKGKASNNLILSEKRAESAVNYLINKGISEDRLISHGFGERIPLIDCKDNCTEEEFQTNRRIEFVVIN
jgi:outer membrane protein OmpA-like peptidoglycan-associated protein